MMKENKMTTTHKIEEEKKQDADKNICFVFGSWFDLIRRHLKLLRLKPVNNNNGSNVVRVCAWIFKFCDIFYSDRSCVTVFKFQHHT